MRKNNLIQLLYLVCLAVIVQSCVNQPQTKIKNLKGFEAATDSIDAFLKSISRKYKPAGRHAGLRLGTSLFQNSLLYIREINCKALLIFMLSYPSTSTLGADIRPKHEF